jgi:glycosyltransferase involved in cell wall biosynthesis
LAAYFLQCAQLLSKTAEVAIIHWPINSEAPFEFENNSSIKLYSKKTYSINELKNLITSFQPNVMVCSGWIDKDYLQLVKPYHKKIPTVLTCDTQWNATPKQYLAMILSRLFLLNKFSHAWVPGEIQYKYAIKLGFRSKQIYQNFYCCDLDFFNKIYLEHSLKKNLDFPKKFIYVGRYYHFKGVTDLWEAFIQLQNETPNDWELWCFGKGDIPPISHTKIKHMGFVQPQNLSSFLLQTGVFVLPSRFEPWGVVVHEYAASGFPLLLSDAVGASKTFLQNDSNGFSFQANNISSLKNALKKIIHLNSETLIEMSKKSHSQAQKVTPEIWVNTIKTIYNEFNK